MKRLCLLAVIVAGWFVLPSVSSYAAPAIPGPLGGPEIAVDVNTMLGKKAPWFTLRDSEGKQYKVVPGRGRPLVVISHMGFYWERCVGQPGELEKSAAALRAIAEAYVVNPDTPENSRKVRAATRLSIPILLDPGYGVARMFDLPGQDRPMGGLVGFVIVDGKGIIRVQRVDIGFGAHAGQIIEIVKIVVRTGG